jgi:hypothetical protein
MLKIICKETQSREKLERKQQALGWQGRGSTIFRRGRRRWRGMRRLIRNSWSGTWTWARWLRRVIRSSWSASSGTRARWLRWVSCRDSWSSTGTWARWRLRWSGSRRRRWEDPDVDLLAGFAVPVLGANVEQMAGLPHGDRVPATLVYVHWSFWVAWMEIFVAHLHHVVLFVVILKICMHVKLQYLATIYIDKTLLITRDFLSRLQLSIQILKNVNLGYSNGGFR